MFLKQHIRMISEDHVTLNYIGVKNNILRYITIENSLLKLYNISQYYHKSYKCSLDEEKRIPSKA